MSSSSLKAPSRGYNLTDLSIEYIGIFLVNNYYDSYISRVFNVFIYKKAIFIR
jgi:hypothetical protein